MPVHLDFDEGWLADYCRRTGQANPLEKDRKGKKAKKPGKSKYHNIPTEVDGKRYPSRKEANRHSELVLAQKAGEIYGWAEQVPFLLPGGVKYVADFVILNKDGTFTVEDAKGVRTDVYKIKKRVMVAMGIEIKEV